MLRASEVFGLSPEETEELANKAGLSIHYYIDGQNKLLTEVLNQRRIRQNLLLDDSNVTERMLQYIKSGMRPSKEAILAITISLGLNIDEIQILLKASGYVLSRSLPNDIVILYLLEHNNCNDEGDSLVWHINDILEELDLPLLGTKFYQKSQN